MKARVTTTGPEAHVIYDEKEIDSNAREWTIYDVGGSRSQRGERLSCHIWPSALNEFTQLRGLNSLTMVRTPLSELVFFPLTSQISEHHYLPCPNVWFQSGSGRGRKREPASAFLLLSRDPVPFPALMLTRCFRRIHYGSGKRSAVTKSSPTLNLSSSSTSWTSSRPN